MVASGLGNSSHVIQNPPRPSEVMAEPCEYVDPGTWSSLIGGPDVGPELKAATTMGDVTPIPVQEPYLVHETNTCRPSCMMAGLSYASRPEPPGSHAPPPVRDPSRRRLVPARLGRERPGSAPPEPEIGLVTMPGPGAMYEVPTKANPS